MNDLKDRYEALLQASAMFPSAMEHPTAVGYIGGFMLGVRCALLNPEYARLLAIHCESVAGPKSEQIEIMNRGLADILVGE